MKAQLNSQITHTTPTGNKPEAGPFAIKDKMLGPNGVRYRRVPLYMFLHRLQLRVQFGRDLSRDTAEDVIKLKEIGETEES